MNALGMKGGDHKNLHKASQDAPLEEISLTLVLTRRTLLLQLGKQGETIHAASQETDNRGSAFSTGIDANAT
jgi:hypothetical protein